MEPFLFFYRVRFLLFSCMTDCVLIIHYALGLQEIFTCEQILLNNIHLKKQIQIEKLSSKTAISPKIYDKLPPGSKRMVVLTTNIAETSITIPDVTVVIDSMRVNEVDFSPKKSLKYLRERLISKASARQRAGRAGRVTAGVVIRLVRKERFEKLSEFSTPEILRVPLDDSIVRILSMKQDVGEFFSNCLDEPQSEAIEQAVKRCVQLGVVESGDGVNGLLKLTTLGWVVLLLLLLFLCVCADFVFL